MVKKRQKIEFLVHGNVRAKKLINIKVRKMSILALKYAYFFGSK